MVGSGPTTCWLSHKATSCQRAVNHWLGIDYLVTNCQALLADPREFDHPRWWDHHCDPQRQPWHFSRNSNTSSLLAFMAQADSKFKAKFPPPLPVAVKPCAGFHSLLRAWQQNHAHIHHLGSSLWWESKLWRAFICSEFTDNVFIRLYYP